MRFYYRPFDLRWLYWEPETNLVDRKREEYFPEVDGHVLWIAAAQDQRRVYDPPVVTRRLSSLHVIERGANLFPLTLHAPQRELHGGDAAANGRQPNASAELQDYVSDMNGVTFEDVFFHVIATVYSPAYRNANCGALLQDWPRIPLPRHWEHLRTSSALGRNVAALLDPEQDVTGVTVEVADHLRSIADITTSDGTQIDPARDLLGTENWGYVDARGAVMPALGAERVRPAREMELAALEPLSADQRNHLGVYTLDVFFNPQVYWSNVPLPVWNFAVGGYPVLKKWLSYRDHRVLGRPLRVEELEEFQRIARRIISILLLNPELDAVYELSRADAIAWPLHR